MNEDVRQGDSNGSGSNSSSSSSSRRLQTWNCYPCRRSKVRCDRHDPCARCVRNGWECTFPISGRMPRRGREGVYPKVPVRRHAQLLGRLRNLETMIADLGSQVESADTSPRGSSESTVEATTGSSHTDADAGPASLVVENDGSLVVGDSFWTVFCNEVEQIFEAAGGAQSRFHPDNHHPPEKGHNRMGYYDFLMRHLSVENGPVQERLLPLPSQMLFIWQTYVERIDPFMKILHIPTMKKIIHQSQRGYGSLSPGNVVLVSAVSMAAISVLDDKEVALNFNETKAALLTRLQLSTERTLGRVDMVRTTDLAPVQGLTIYLSTLQHTGELDTAWALAGFLVRIAVRLGLHRGQDSSRADANYFEVEMRCRLWWQICLIDSRSGNPQATRFLITESMFDTRLPANVNDADLGPDMDHPPPNRAEPTDMTTFLFRCEFWLLSRRLRSRLAAGHVVDAFELLQRSRQHIEGSYVKNLAGEHGRPAPVPTPIHEFTYTMAQLVLKKIELMLLSSSARAQPPQQSSTPPESAGGRPRYADSGREEDKVFAYALSIIEYDHALQTEPDWQLWRSLIPSRSIPWHALGIVLSRLRDDRVPGPDRERAWTSAQKSFGLIPPEARRGPAYDVLARLADEVRSRPEGAPRVSAEGGTPEGMMSGQPAGSIQLPQNADPQSAAAPTLVSGPEQLHYDRPGDTGVLAGDLTNPFWGYPSMMDSGSDWSSTLLGDPMQWEWDPWMSDVGSQNWDVWKAGMI